MKKSKTLLELFLAFLKIGAFTFGGGYAMIAILQNELVQKKNWIAEDEFLDIVAVAESTPGPIAINAATYIGYKRAGVLGSAAATVGVVVPSFVIIYAISLFFDAFIALTVVKNAFRGIQAAVVYLILAAGVRMLKKLRRDPVSVTLLVLTVACMVTLSILAVSFSTIFYILLGGLVGFVVWLCRRMKGGETK